MTQLHIWREDLKDTNRLVALKALVGARLNQIADQKNKQKIAESILHRFLPDQTNNLGAQAAGLLESEDVCTAVKAVVCLGQADLLKGPKSSTSQYKVSYALRIQRLDAPKALCDKWINDTIIRELLGSKWGRRKATRTRCGHCTR